MNNLPMRYFKSIIIGLAVTIIQLSASHVYEQAISEYNRQLAILDLCNTSINAAEIGLSNKHVVVTFCSNKQKIETLLGREKKETLILFDQDISRNVIEALARCEHFDIIVIDELSYIQISQSTINKENLLLLGDIIIIRRFEQQENLHDYIIKGTSRKMLATRHIFYPHGQRGKTHTVVSTHDTKILIKTSQDKTFTVPWLAGINLLTFVAFNGIYPSQTQLNSEIDLLEKIPHPDWSPANMLLTGKKLIFIDRIDNWNGRYPSPRIFKQWVQATRALFAPGSIEAKRNLYVRTFC